MSNLRNLIAMVLLTFMAISLLVASLQYSSDVIEVMVQNDTVLPTDVTISGAANSTGDSSPDSSGALSASSPDGGFNLSKLGVGGGGPKDPDDPDDPTNYLLLFIIFLVVLVFLGLIGYLLLRRRGKKTPPAGEPIAAAATAPGSFEGDYRIRFPGISEPFPAIWGEGEALEIRIEAREGAANEAHDAVLDIDGKVTREISLEDGAAQARIDLGKGSHRITVSAKGGAATPSWAEVWIVDYREEVVRMFNEMYLNYSSRYKGVEDKLTPRELEKAVSPKMPEINRKALGVAVTVFELASYSLHAIRRRDFERMYLSRMDAARAPEA